MQSRGFKRPGAWQMLIAIAGAIAAGVYPLLLAARSSSHEFVMFLTGMGALAMMLAYGLLLLLYLIGFIRYASSKGYGPLVIILLLCANVLGLLLLLVLPDRRSDNFPSAA